MHNSPGRYLYFAGGRRQKKQISPMPHGIVELTYVCPCN